MGLRRISTPHDLGAAVRDARTAAQLTQADLAVRAGVSREWLIGLEGGARPRAELSKILDVLSALDEPLAVGRDEVAETSGRASRSPHRGERLSTTEVTRRAIERTRRPVAEAGSGRDVDLSSLLPKADLSALRPAADLSALMPQPSADLRRILRGLAPALGAMHEGGGSDDDRGDQRSGGGADAEVDAAVEDVAHEDAIADEGSEGRGGLP